MGWALASINGLFKLCFIQSLYFSSAHTKVFMEYIILFRAYFNKLYIHTQMKVQAFPNKSAEETDRFSKMLIIVETG